MRLFTPQDIVWLAGVLEGEGSFEWRVDKRPNRTQYGWPAVAMGSTDLDVLERVALLMSATSITKYQGSHLGKKPMFKTIVYGMNAADVMRAILPYMGVRRSARIRDLLNRWDGRPKTRQRRRKCELLSVLLSQPGYSAVLR